MNWTIKRILNLSADRPWEDGFCAFGFHGATGKQYMLHYEENWLGCLTPGNEFMWTAGTLDKGLSKNHISFDLKHPHYLTEMPDGSVLVSSAGTKKIVHIEPHLRVARTLIDADRIGLKDIGNCVLDTQGNIWVNEVQGCRVWEFSASGQLILTLGNGQAGFQVGTVPFDEVQFSWIYDLRPGPDGNLYVLDSKNYSIRRIDPSQKTVSTVAGTGKPGGVEDGVSALQATLGGNPSHYFDGPLALAVDEECNLYIGDTHNHVVRVIDNITQRISTIAGRHGAESDVRNDPLETDPSRLCLPYIGSLDYYDGHLFVPTSFLSLGSDDLIVLQRQP